MIGRVHVGIRRGGQFASELSSQWYPTLLEFANPALGFAAAAMLLPAMLSLDAFGQIIATSAREVASRRHGTASDVLSLIDSIG